MTLFWSSMAKRTEPYVPGLQLNRDVIKLNTNENPYPPSPKVIQAIQAEVEKSLQLYPSPTADALRNAIASSYQVEKDHVFVGNGSDEVLAFSFMAFFEPGRPIRFPNITYSFYPVYAKLFNIPFEEIKVLEDFSLPVQRFFQSEGGVVLPNPNAPTSLYLDIEQIEDIVKHNPERVVIIDEAYIDFAKASAVPLTKRYQNLLVVQTTSKSRALAGLRVGYAIGHPSLIEALTRIKDSFNSYTLDRLAIVGATEAFKDIDYYQKVTERIVETREQAKKKLKQLGFSVLPSQTNFLFVTHPHYDAPTLYQQLLDEGILVRHFNQNTINQYLRITIGTDEQMIVLFKTLEKLLNQ